MTKQEEAALTSAEPDDTSATAAASWLRNPDKALSPSPMTLAEELAAEPQWTGPWPDEENPDTGDPDA